VSYGFVLVRVRVRSETDLRGRRAKHQRTRAVSATDEKPTTFPKLCCCPQVLFIPIQPTPPQVYARDGCETTAFSQGGIHTNPLPLRYEASFRGECFISSSKCGAIESVCPSGRKGEVPATTTRQQLSSRLAPQPEQANDIFGCEVKAISHAMSGGGAFMRLDVHGRLHPSKSHRNSPATAVCLHLCPISIDEKRRKPRSLKCKQHPLQLSVFHVIHRCHILQLPETT
jgi:hypothetical protein